ncbi:MAG: glycosyltransferase family 4 protein [Saprospirales bacterium]|nr:glycosyltransferase family 4 protein [Saprospirales bacterium]
MKKVLSIVFNNFLHDSRVLKECISLKNAGYEVQVAALHSGELPEEEVVAGIPVTRIRLRTRHWSKNRLVQLIKYAELWVRLIRMARHADILHCNDLEPLPVVVLAKWLVNRRAKIVYDAHELEFDKSEAHTKYYPRFFLRLAERFFIRHANAMIVVSPLIADAYVERYGITRPAVVMNCPNYHAPQPHADIFRKTFGIRPDQRIYLYQGGLIPHRGVEPLLEIFSQLDDSKVLVVLGFGPLTSLVEKYAADFPGIYYHPAVAPTELDRYTACADVGFCLYQGISGNHNLTIGNKIFQYIMAGLPVLASNLAGLKYVLNAHMGIVVENFRDPDQLEEAVLQIGAWKKEDYLPHLHEAALQYNWENQETVLLNVYHSLYESR